VLAVSDVLARNTWRGAPGDPSLALGAWPVASWGGLRQFWTSVGELRGSRAVVHYLTTPRSSSAVALAASCNLDASMALPAAGGWRACG
jgi:hypothetical protein